MVLLMSASALQAAPGGVAVAGLSQAKRHKRRFDAVITLEDPEARRRDKLRFNRQPAPAHLVLAFEDVDEAASGVRVATEAQVVEALAFAREHASGSLLVHCFHGVGRSAAMGLAILADRIGAGAEGAAVEELFRVRPEATPNLVVVDHADRVLNRAGKLIGALASWEATVPQIKAMRQARLAFFRENFHLYCRY